MAVGAVSKMTGQSAANKQARATQEEALNAAYKDVAMLDLRGIQMQQSASQQALDRQRQTLKQRAKIMTAAGEAGVQGSSLLRMLNVEQLDEQRDIGIISSNLENQQVQNTFDANKVMANAYSRYNQAGSQIQNPLVASGMLGLIPAAILSQQ